jgi:CheY-like chemotaxis protein
LPSSASSTTPAIVDTPTSQERPRILVVDDNLINLKLLATYLKKRNVPVLDTAEDGQTAVTLVERMSGGYDIIFMDMSMPVMDGFEATRAIRAIEQGRGGSERSHIIAFTGLTSPTHESKAMDAGASMFLTKPVSFKEVSRILGEWEHGII